MPDPLIFVLTLAVALGSALMAGTFFAFSTFVMRALGRLPPAQGIAAMQSINVAVINPWFLGAFLGTAAGCVVLGALSLIGWGAPGAAWRLAGSLLYLVGTIVVTISFNVPLNDRLATADAGSAAGAELWARYQARWTSWNHVRTAAPLAALACVILALR